MTEKFREVQRSVELFGFGKREKKKNMEIWIKTSRMAVGKQSIEEIYPGGFGSRVSNLFTRLSQSTEIPHSDELLVVWYSHFKVSFHYFGNLILDKLD